MQAEEEVGKEIHKDQNSRNIEAKYTAEVNLNLTVVPVDFGWFVLTDKEKKVATTQQIRASFSQNKKQKIWIYSNS